MLPAPPSKLEPELVKITKFVVEPVLIKLKVNPAWWDSFNSGKVIFILVEPVNENISVCSNGRLNVADVPEIIFTLFIICVCLCVKSLLIVVDMLEIVNGVVVLPTLSFVLKLYVVFKVVPVVVMAESKIKSSPTRCSVM